MRSRFSTSFPCVLSLSLSLSLPVTLSLSLSLSLSPSFFSISLALLLYLSLKLSFFSSVSVPLLPFFLFVSLSFHLFPAFYVYAHTYVSPSLFLPPPYFTTIIFRPFLFSSGFYPFVFPPPPAHGPPFTAVGF